MSERKINLAAVKRNPDVHLLADDARALVEAVEAAHVVVTEHEADNPFLGIAIEVLAETHRRFDFGEAQP